MVTLDEAVLIVKELVAHSVAAGEPIDATLVAVGGTALAAHGVRALSEDVDLFVRTCSADVIDEVEALGRARHGPAFKLDVTPAENLWGAILVRDIDRDARSVVATFDAGGRRFELRALSIETLLLIKLAAGRERDLRDLPLLAARTTADALIDRFNTLVVWHGDRHSVPAFADALVRQLESLFGCGPEVIDRLAVSRELRRMLWEAQAPEA